MFSAGRPPIALITGGNKGLGLETGRQLAQRGVLVVLGSRDLVRGRYAAANLRGLGPGVEVVQLDVTDQASIAAARDQLIDLTGRLDILINNAGIIVEALVTEVTAVQLRPVFETNLFGVASVTTAMLPLLASSEHPRIVNVSSTTASLALTANGIDFGGTTEMRMAYAPSKAALNMLTLQYARAFAFTADLRHIKVNAATPGYTATDLNAGKGDRTVEEGARAIVAMATLEDDGPTGTFVNDEGPVAW
jgi:NAD(P)-dependent dehydrogenase (short-subunit alcohol dehydrogenase family)